MKMNSTKHPSLFLQHLFHHHQVLMTVYYNQNVLTLTFHFNKFITFGLLCFSIFIIYMIVGRVFTDGPGDQGSIPG